MNRDAHYYAVLALCRACGFTKDSAHIVAYASQYVDDAKVNLIFIDGPSLDIEHDTVNNRPAFFNMATCHSYFRIKTFNYEAMVNNTCAFHFVPGCKGENFTKRLRCQEESPVILRILEDVFLEANLFKLGIALHAYADTFSHQGFSGMLSKVNDIKQCRPNSVADLELLDRILRWVKKLTSSSYDVLFDRVMPAYGHVQAIDYPDIPHLSWSYQYDYSDEFNGSYTLSTIDNKDRFLRAFTSIEKLLERYLLNYPQYRDNEVRFKNFDMLFEALILKGTNKAKENHWIQFLWKQELFDRAECQRLIYDENQWLKEAFSNFDPHIFNHREVEEAQLADNFQNSCWYSFYQSVKWYKQRFFQYCCDLKLNIPT